MWTLLVVTASAFEGVRTGATWTFLDTGVAPTSDWTTLAFDDSAWSTGVASLGFGVTGRDTPITNHGGYTWYFRTTFTVADATAITDAIMDLRFDDGAVAWLNGVELARWNMPPGTIDDATPALGPTGSPWVRSDQVVSPAALVDGDNVLAIEVHQASATSSDVFLEASLSLSPFVEIGPYVLQADASQARIVWEGHDAASGTVEWGTTTGYGASATDAAVAERHDVLLTGLSGGQTYHYRVMADGYTSGDLTFRAPPDPADGTLRVVLYGDSRGEPDVHAQVAAAIAALDPDLVVHTGDWVDSGAEDELWAPQAFDPMAAFLSSVPLLPAVGNHESPYLLPSSTVRARFPTPTGDDWWTMAVGPARFIVLESNDPDFNGDNGDPDLSAQWAWLEAELAAATEPYVFVVQHHPAYDSGFHAANSDVSTFRTWLAPLLESYGVTALVAGHEHRLERSWHGGTTYLTSGGGGAELQPACVDGGSGACDNPYQQFLAESHGFMLLEIDGADATVTTYDASGAVLDGPVPLTNTPPTIELDAPADACATAHDTLEVTWTGADAEGAAWVDLYADTDGAGCDGTLLDGGFDLLDGGATVDPGALTDGTWYVYAIADDGDATTCAYAPEPVRVAHPTTTGDLLIGLGAEWAYWSTGAAPTGTWKTRTYDDSGWPTGCGELGWGDGGEATTLPVANTAYFRRAFTWSGAAPSSLVLEAAIDDGAVVYLNNKRVAAKRMGAGTPTYATYATSAGEGVPRSVTTLTALAPTYLVSGTNVLAVEVHQVSAASTDLSWDAMLVAVP